MSVGINLEPIIQRTLTEIQRAEKSRESIVRSLVRLLTAHPAAQSLAVKADVAEKLDAFAACAMRVVQDQHVHDRLLFEQQRSYLIRLLAGER